MDNDKSILEKFTDTVKDITKVATSAVSDAMKLDAPASKADERAVAYMPLAAEGVVFDPLMLAPVAVPPSRKKRAVSKRVAKAARNETERKEVAKSSGKTAKKSTGRRATGKTAKKTVKKAAKKTSKAPAKKAKKGGKKAQQKAPRKATKARKGKRGR